MRLIAIAAALLALAPAGAHARARITVDGASLRAPVPANPFFEGLTAVVSLRVKAARRAALRVGARCVHGPCATTVVADRRGRWRARLHVLRSGGTRRIGVRIGYVDAAEGEASPLLTRPLALPAWATAWPYAGDDDVPQLNMVGDSLAVGTAPHLRAAMPEWRVTSDGRVGRPLAEGMALFGAARSLVPDGPSVFAFSLFTNDDPRGIEALDAAVRASVAALPDRSCAVWATIVRPKVGGMSYRLVNERLHALAEELGERLLIVDWAAAVRENRDWIADDRVHATYAGYAERARLYAEAALECRALRGW